MYHTDETIAAIASAAGGAGRGIVRLSGPAVIPIIERCFRVPSEAGSLRAIRVATAVAGTLQLVESPLDALPVDLYLWPSARSYTRQPAAEIHATGSPPLLSAILRTVCAHGARLAEPGEFTLRAFLAGRLDLTQAEAVLGVIDARGQPEFEGALEQLAGGLRRPLHALRDLLVDLLAQLEAGLDFAEEDIQFVTEDEVALELDRAVESIGQLVDQLTERRRSEELPTVVLAGRPNTGKSSLFNALAAGAGALVSDKPGTTRDYLDAILDLNGVRCQLIDTAGFEVDTGARTIAGIAQQLGASRLQMSDVRLLCLDSTRILNDWERDQLAAPKRPRQLVVLTKCDGPRRVEPLTEAIETSATSGLGLDQLRQALRQAVAGAQSHESAAALTCERCGEGLSAAAESLSRAAELNRARAGEELVAAELRGALSELGRVVGTVYTDDILDRIFSRFCIGK